MSKVSEYLNEHLSGEVTTNEHVRRAFATDGSILSIKPDMVIYPRTTSDLRKIARFSWQLAEKGHKLSITMRGGGSDQTGAAIGAGVVVNTTAHMDTIFEVDTKQKLVRAQPGVTFRALNQALQLQGLYIPSFPASQAYSTIGGAIANNASGIMSGQYGSTLAWVKQLEVVLSNGEVLQTGRLNKRDVARKKGLQTFEGEIYRNIDNLAVDNDQLIDSIAIDVRDNTGYNIVDVKNRDESIDLTPLFVGSQGTLGIISEVILAAEPIGGESLTGAVAFFDYESARDGMDAIRELDPTILEYIDGRILARAKANGNHYSFYAGALEKDDVAAVLVFEFDDASNHAKKKAAKKIAKMFQDKPAYVVLEDKETKTTELRLLETLPTLALVPEKSSLSDPGALHGAYIPPERFEDFTKSIEKLEAKYHAELPLTGHVTQSVYHARLLVDPTKPADRHKVLKLLAEWSALVAAHDGYLLGEAAEGRLKALFAYKEVEDDVKQMFTAIRDIFDPMGTMNTGAKQDVDLKKLVSDLRSDYDKADFAGYVEGS